MVKLIIDTDPGVGMVPFTSLLTSVMYRLTPSGLPRDAIRTLEALLCKMKHLPREVLFGAVARAEFAS